MEQILEIINKFFNQLGLATDWTITWESILSLFFGIVTILPFLGKIFRQKDIDSSKFEHEQSTLNQRDTKIYFNGELSVEFYAAYGDVVELSVRYLANSKGNFKSKNIDFYDVYADPIIYGRQSHKVIVGFNKYEFRLLNADEIDDEVSGILLSIIRIPRTMFFVPYQTKLFRWCLLSFGISLIAYSILITIYGSELTIRGFPDIGYLFHTTSWLLSTGIGICVFLFSVLIDMGRYIMRPRDRR